MSFSPEWLALRLDADRRARNPAVLEAVKKYFAGDRSAGLEVLDLGAGTGNNMALTTPHLPQGGNWTLVDSDDLLLAQASEVEGTDLTVCRADLARDLESVLANPPADGFDLVTCSALLDLCGAGWLDRLADGLARHRLPFFATLSYDGRAEWTPPRSDDAAVLAAFHEDQRRDKGFGPALGPEAHAHLAEALRCRSFKVLEGASDWVLTPSADGPLIAELAEGVGQVAGNPEWGAARQEATRVRIGHRDLFAAPLD